MAKKTTAPTADEIRARAQANIEAEKAAAAAAEQTPAAQAAAEEAPQDKLKFKPEESDELSFEATGVSQFDEILEFQTPGEIFTGVYLKTQEFDGFTDDEGNKKPMLVFERWKTKEICIANPNWQLYEFFVNRNTRTEINWDKAVFQITFVGYNKTSGGNKVSKFQIKVAHRA